MTVEVAGVILAAGRSTRMGSENKLLRLFHSKPLLRHVLDAAMSSNLARLVLVTGHEHLAIEAILPDDFPTIHNYEFEGGMAGSIRAGIYRLQGKFPVMILLGDMPLVTECLINEMIETYNAADQNSSIIAAARDGEIGNPILFGTDYFAALKMLDGDRGARALVRHNRQNLILVEAGNAADLDLDTTEAFEAAK